MLLLLTFLIDAIFIGGLVVWVWLAMRLWRREPLLPYEPRRPVPWGGIDLAVVIAAIIVLQGLCLGVAVKWSGMEMPNDWSDLDPQARFVVLSGNLVANVLTLVVAAVILFWQTDARWSDLGVDLRACAVRSAMRRDRLCRGRPGSVRVARIDHAMGSLSSPTRERGSGKERRGDVDCGGGVGGSRRSGVRRVFLSRAAARVAGENRVATRAWHRVGQRRS